MNLHVDRATGVWGWLRKGRKGWHQGRLALLFRTKTKS